MKELKIHTERFEVDQNTWDEPAHEMAEEYLMEGAKHLLKFMKKHHGAVQSIADVRVYESHGYGLLLLKVDSEFPSSTRGKQSPLFVW